LIAAGADCGTTLGSLLLIDRVRRHNRVAAAVLAGSLDALYTAVVVRNARVLAVQRRQR
jgi:hypothetical protein